MPAKSTHGGKRPGAGAKPGNTNSLKNGLYSGRVRALTLALEHMRPEALAAFRAADKRQVIVFARALNHCARLALRARGLDPSTLQLRTSPGPDSKKRKTAKSIKRSSDPARAGAMTHACPDRSRRIEGGRG